MGWTVFHQLVERHGPSGGPIRPSARSTLAFPPTAANTLHPSLPLPSTVRMPPPVPFCFTDLLCRRRPPALPPPPPTPRSPSRLRSMETSAAPPPQEQAPPHPPLLSLSSLRTPESRMNPCTRSYRGNQSITHLGAGEVANLVLSMVCFRGNRVCFASMLSFGNAEMPVQWLNGLSLQHVSHWKFPSSDWFVRPTS